MDTSFRVDLNLLIELGEQLISKDEIALTELVKNSYDADARVVEINLADDTIEVTDDGIGMDEYDIANGWLLVGRSIKNSKKLDLP